MDSEGRSGGHVITAVAGSGINKQTYNYATERVVGNGSFGVVFQATCLETAETVRVRQQRAQPCTWRRWGGASAGLAACSEAAGWPAVVFGMRQSQGRQGSCCPTTQQAFRTHLLLGTQRQRQQVQRAACWSGSAQRTPPCVPPVLVTVALWPLRWPWQVAIKKVLQDKRFKNRELQIMKVVDHPNIVKLKQCFYSHTEKDETFLHLVLEYVPDTVYRWVPCRGARV